MEDEDYTIDLAQSFEVAEHIEEEYADIFLHNLLKDDPDIVLLTAAPIGQHGFKHVNCQEREYWMTKMKNMGWLFSQDLLHTVMEWGAPKKCPLWWANNLMVFA